MFFFIAFPLLVNVEIEQIDRLGEPVQCAAAKASRTASTPLCGEDKTGTFMPARAGTNRAIDT
jgi:hypothetical protein